MQQRVAVSLSSEMFYCRFHAANSVAFRLRILTARIYASIRASDRWERNQGPKIKFFYEFADIRRAHRNRIQTTRKNTPLPRIAGIATALVTPHARCTRLVDKRQHRHKNSREEMIHNEQRCITCAGKEERKEKKRWSNSFSAYSHDKRSRSEATQTCTSTKLTEPSTCANRCSYYFPRHSLLCSRASRDIRNQFSNRTPADEWICMSHEGKKSL